MDTEDTNLKEQLKCLIMESHNPYNEDIKKELIRLIEYILKEIKNNKN